MAVAAPAADPLTSSGTALVNDIIAPLHFADDPMQQAGSDHFVLAKLRRDVLKQGFAAGSTTGLAACINRSKSWRGGAIAVGPVGSRQAPHQKL